MDSSDELTAGGELVACDYQFNTGALQVLVRQDISESSTASCLQDPPFLSAHYNR